MHSGESKLSKHPTKSPLEKKRLDYEVPVFPILKNIQNAYWKDEGKYIKLLAHETQHSPPLRVGVMFSGGPAAGGLNVLWGLYKGLKDIHSESALIGFLDGAGGFLEDRQIEITDKEIAEIKNQGGFTLLGTGRTKIETEGQMRQALEVVKKNRLQGLVFVGGDDTNTNAYHLSKYLEKEKARCSVVGIPKTIDGDLKGGGIEASFGFDTATKTYSSMIGNLNKDALSAKKYWFFVKLMGRSASHVTLECALQTKPNLAFISEEVQKKKITFKKIVEMVAKTVIERAEAGKNYGTTLIPEGLIEACSDMKAMIDACNTLKKEGKSAKDLTGEEKELFDSLPPAIQKQLQKDLDPHGNMQLSLVSTDQLIAEMVEEKVKDKKGVEFKVVPIFYGYDGRCALPSNFDATYCYNLGMIASILVRDRKTGFMASVKGLDQPVGEWSGIAIPIENMMSQEERHGKLKSVIAKALVDLKGKPFKEFSKKRDKWKIEDHYESPGPIQYDDEASIGFSKTLTLGLEQKKSSFF
ncbi:MAG: Pyrophosphate--fructose 6-phosphate 1-phosphotransferase [Chlamydiia bacterium]|nr:Pyrophosphate--fructose 6-phosphate 1-phosphotransferase [Chlamydiia bacterium]MCH9618037.1 Pyrophosphate--fructose 6-phosphate 1-phosphotransferase [Chlamydiia bacterium]MCH9623638.1 Pyrophosphate--fructose 6-phosphate 1-phosphotransferase [Chlamydiia bacterium]